MFGISSWFDWLIGSGSNKILDNSAILGSKSNAHETIEDSGENNKLVQLYNQCQHQDFLIFDDQLDTFELENNTKVSSMEEVESNLVNNKHEIIEIPSAPVEVISYEADPIIIKKRNLRNHELAALNIQLIIFLLSNYNFKDTIHYKLQESTPRKALNSNDLKKCCLSQPVKKKNVKLSEVKTQTTIENESFIQHRSVEFTRLINFWNKGVERFISIFNEEPIKTDLIPVRDYDFTYLSEKFDNKTEDY